MTDINYTLIGNNPHIFMKRTVYTDAQIAKNNLCLLMEVLKRMDMNIVRIVVAKWRMKIDERIPC